MIKLIIFGNPLTLLAGFSFTKMKIKELLREYNEQRLINDFGNKILSHIKTDPTAPKNVAVPAIINKITSIDPSPNKELTFWCVLNYANASDPKFNSGITRFEDIGRAMNALEDFKKLLKKPNLNPQLPIRGYESNQGSSKFRKNC